MGSPAGQIEMEEAMSPEESLPYLESKMRNLGAELSEVDLKMWALIDEMPKPIMRGQIGFGTKSPPSETDLGNLAELSERLKELKLEAEKVYDQIAEIRLEEQKKENAMLLIPQLIVIAFVNELEKADQYFDFQESLKAKGNITEDSNEIDVVKELLHDAAREKFDKLDEEFLQHAVAAAISQKRVDNAHAKRLKHIEYLKDFEKWECEGSNVKKNMSKLTEYNDIAGSWPILELGPEEIDTHAITHPICYLVFLTREKRNVMDQDPEEELKKIEKFDSLFFNRYIQEEFPRGEFEKIMSTYKDTSREEALARVRTELYKKALDRYNTITKKYAGSQTEDTDNPFEDKLMLDSNRKRSLRSKNVGESSQSLPSVRTRTQPHRSVRTRTQPHRSVRTRT